jgi:hypothetical protein
VSAPLRSWFATLPAGQTVVMRPGACYLVDRGLKLNDPQRLTVYGGTFRNAATVPGPGAHSKGHPVITVIGGHGITFESMQISGANPGGYHPSLAFAGGIELEGTSQATIRGVTITDTFGDGITLVPLRGGRNHNSGTIIAPPSEITVRDVTIDGAGRQGVTFSSVSGAQLSDVVVKNPGLDTFDVEADQSNEGASDVTIDGCTASGGAFFFANGGKGAGSFTHDIVVEHCSMAKPENGTTILVARAPHIKGLRGPFTFTADSLWCGASVYVACLQLSGATVTVADSVLQFPGGTVHEPVYHLSRQSMVRLIGDVVTGYGRDGSVSARSEVHISLGTWTPWGRPPEKK